MEHTIYDDTDLSLYLSMKPSAEDLAWDHAMDISASIFTRLNELNMTQKALADAIGVSASRISQIIKGEPGMSLKTLARIESALDFDLGTGFHYKAEKSSGATASTSNIQESSRASSLANRSKMSIKHSNLIVIEGGLAA